MKTPFYKYLSASFIILTLFNVQNTRSQNDSSTISLLFMGDIMGHDSQITAALQENGNYDYTECFKFVNSRIDSADLAFANLEVTLAGEPYKGYPQFSSPDALASALKQTGIDVLVTANNHACDRGRNGITRTIQVLDSLQFLRTGTFTDSSDYNKNNPLIIEKKNFKIALLNYTYGTNGIPVPDGQIVNLINKSKIESDLTQTRALNPDLIIAFMHWGTEYQTTSNSAQKDLAKFLTANGVSLIIGSHPHVLQPMEFDSISNKLIVYSLGNFISAQRKAPRDGGVIVNVQIEKNNDQIKIKHADYELTYVHYPFINGKRHFMIIPASDVGKDFIANAPGNQGWGRLFEYTSEAREILKQNVNVPEKYAEGIYDTQSQVTTKK